jgi:hypothetical protein
MLVKYQQKWSSMFPDSIIDEASRVEWASQIQGLTSKHINYALEICFDYYPEWPPNPGQFKSLCKMAELEPDYIPLKIDNPTKPETIKSEISKMKSFLNGRYA